MKDLRTADWQLQNSHGDVNYSMGKRVSNIVMTMYGAGWIIEILRCTICRIYDCLATVLYI